jgi:FkbM family methyltransferase
MDIETQKILDKNPNKIIFDLNEENDKKIFELYNTKKNSLFIIIFFFFLSLVLLYFSIKNKSSNNNNYLLNKKSNLNSFEEFQYYDFDEDILLKYRQQQNEFCDKQVKYIRKEFEDIITVANVSYLSQFFKMYIYKRDDIVSLQISQMESWEEDETNNLLTALTFYSAIKKLKREEIYVLDIGSNIGWYTLFIAKYGYNILSFDPSYINDYILKKSYCLNRELNITIINKGLYSEEKICDLYVNMSNVGDGLVFCENQDNVNNLKRTGAAILTKLNHFASFLLKNNLGLIKIDTEGSEGKVIEGGIKLITKYHVPFIFLEFCPQNLMKHGTDPRKFLKIFIKNGYKIAWYNFFSEDYLSIDEIMERTGSGSMNLYIVNSRIIKKYHYF